MVENSEIRKIYSELQKQLFYLIPEKWDRIYLYASVEEKIRGIETGELFFYYFPKGILKKNPVNVYEVPNKFSLNEDEYIKLVGKLYEEIKKIRNLFKAKGHRLWHSVTIRIEGLKFEIEYNYDEFKLKNFLDTDRHIIWKYNNLKLPDEAFSKHDKKIIQDYINESIYFSPDIETYTESIYKNPVKKILIYNREKRPALYIADAKPERYDAQAKSKKIEQHYTYKIKGRSRIIKPNIIDKKVKPKSYIEQIEEQRNSVKSQILKHM